MEKLKTIAGVNLLLILLYSIIIRLIFTASGEYYDDLGVLLVSMFVITIHVGLNLLAAIIFFVQKNNSLGKAFLISTVIVLIIGFSACIGNSSL